MSENLPVEIDSANPHALSLVCPIEIADRIADLPIELLEQDEVTLSTIIQPTPQMKRLKIQFWDEYEIALREQRRMLMIRVIWGVCTKEYFNKFVVPVRALAWLICPRPSYQVRVAELIERGLDQIEKVFNIETNAKNEVAVRNLQLSALRMLDMRKHGGYTQRVEQKSLNLTQNLDGKSLSESTQSLNANSVEELEAEIAELTKRVEQGKNQNGAMLSQTAPSSTIIDIKPRTVDGEPERVAVKATQGSHRD